MMRYFLLSVLVVSLVGVLIFSNGGIEAEAATNTFYEIYTDPENKFSIEYPNNLKVLSNLEGENVVAFYSEGGQVNVWLGIGPGSDIDPEWPAFDDSQLLQVVKDVALNMKPGGFIKETKILKLDANTKAFLVNYTWQENNHSMFSLMANIYYENMSWIIMTQSNDPKDNSNIFLPMIKSFRLLGTTDSIQTPNPTTVTQPVQQPVTQPVQQPPFDPAPILILVGLGIITGIVVVVIKSRRKTSGSSGGGGGTTLLFYECPDCGGGNLEENQDGSQHCLNPKCGWKN